MRNEDHIIANYPCELIHIYMEKYLHKHQMLENIKWALNKIWLVWTVRIFYFENLNKISNKFSKEQPFVQ